VLILYYVVSGNFAQIILIKNTMFKLKVTSAVIVCLFALITNITIAQLLFINQIALMQN